MVANKTLQTFVLYITMLIEIEMSYLLLCRMAFTGFIVLGIFQTEQSNAAFSAIPIYLFIQNNEGDIMYSAHKFK